MDSVLLKTPLGFISFFLITFLTIYLLWPAAVFKFVRWATAKMIRLEVRYAEHKGYRFCYYSRGKPGLQPSILMLHGYSIAKDSWIINMFFLPKHLHVVCLDMPGHGKTTCLPGESYNTLDQVKRVHQFVECTGLNRKPFHLVGISMGGMVAGVYAAHYPSEVCCLSLLCPLGLHFPKDTDLMKRMMEKSKNHDVSLIPSNAQEAVKLFCVGSYYSCMIPKQFLRGFFTDWLLETNFFTKCYLDILSDESLYSLQDNMSKIKVPTQVIWGKEDRILDISGAEVLAKGIPHAQVHLLEKCGHFQPCDAPLKTSQLLLDFHTSYMKNKKMA